jgi:hypothetical protein
MDGDKKGFFFFLLSLLVPTSERRYFPQVIHATSAWAI